MKKKITSMMLAIVVAIVPFILCCASNASDACSSDIMEGVESIADDMSEAREDGKISGADQKNIIENYPLEMVNEYNELAEDEAEELIEEMPSIIIKNDTEFENNQVYDLECGAQLNLSVIVENVEDLQLNEDEGMLAKLGELICPVSYADSQSQSFGTKKFTVVATVIAGGTVSLTMNVWVNASSDGLKITKLTRTSNSTLYGQDVKTKKLIEKETATDVGSKCKAKAGVQYYYEYVLFKLGDFGHSKKKWNKARCIYTIQRINRTSVTYYFDYDHWKDDTWSD